MFQGVAFYLKVDIPALEFSRTSVPPLMDGLRVLPGISEFDEYAKTGALFIDKNLFIKDFMNNAAHVSVFLRPRRFGKSMNLSLLHEFLSLDANVHIFRGYQIYNQVNFLTEHGAKYPVIYIDFKSINSSTW